jgi:hypothetical protein
MKKSKHFYDRLLFTELKRDENYTKIGFLVMGIILLVILADAFYLTLNADKKQLTKTIYQQVYITPTPTANQTPTVIPTQITQQNQPATQPLVKEYFVPLGTGSNQSTDWTDVAGAQATLNFGNYQHIKEVTFEVAVNVPTANETVSLRLFNETDHHPVWYSDVTLTNGQYGVSAPIVWDSGDKVYQVQMKTQLGYVANLTQSRIHITLQ